MTFHTPTAKTIAKLTGLRRKLEVRRRDQLPRARRDWLATILAVTSLVVSGGTAYFNIVSQTDDVRVIFHELPNVYLGEILKGNTLEEKEKDVIYLQGSSSLIFANAGNRSVGIARFGISISQPYKGDSSDHDCSDLGYDGVWGFNFAWPTILVKGKDLGAQAAKFSKDDILHSGLTAGVAITEDETVVSVPLTELNAKRESRLVRICAFFTVITPDEVALEVTVPLYDYIFQKSRSDIKWRICPWEPTPLLRRSGTIFGGPNNPSDLLREQQRDQAQRSRTCLPLENKRE